MVSIARRTARLQATLITALLAWLLMPRERDDRGDVPGWVMVTVMSAGLVMVVWGVAQDELSGMVRTALHSVK